MIPELLIADKNEHHYYDAHFPGLNSIVLERTDDCLKRVFVAMPGDLHSDLMSEQGKFLWHEHGYDLRETTLAGQVTNINVRKYVPNTYPEPQLFKIYNIKAGIDTGTIPELQDMKETISLQKTSCVTYNVGESYTLSHDIIHRVVFTPDDVGWFACYVEELKKYTPLDVVYSPHELDGVPNADKLYKRLEVEQAQEILNGLHKNMIKQQTRQGSYV